MSIVTGIVLCHDYADDSTVAQINAWLLNAGFAELGDLTDYASGSKHPQMTILGAGYNHFPEEEFLEFFDTLPWQNKPVLVIRPEWGPIEGYHVAPPKEIAKLTATIATQKETIIDLQEIVKANAITIRKLMENIFNYKGDAVKVSEAEHG